MKRLYLVLLISITSLGVIIVHAQEDTNTLTPGDSVTVTLEPNATATYPLDLEYGESALITTRSQFTGRVSLDGATAENIASHDIQFTDAPLTNRIVAQGYSPYILTLTNTDDTAGEITLELNSVEVHTLEFGDRYIFHDEQAPIFELRFQAEADQQLIIETNHHEIGYSLEQVAADGTVTPITPFSGRFDRLAVLNIPADSTYRIVVDHIFDSRGEPITNGDMYVEVREAEQITETMEVNTTFNDRFGPVRLAFAIDLDAGQTIQARVISDGAHATFTDPVGEVLASYGEPGVAHEYFELQMTAPENATYTLHISNPEFGDLFRYQLILHIEALSYVITEPLALGETATVTLEPGKFAFYQLDLADGESAMLTNTGDLNRSIVAYDAGGHWLWYGGGYFTEDPTRSDRAVGTGTAPYFYEIQNRGDMTGEFTISMAETESHILALGERYVLTAEQDFPFEVIFEGQAWQTVLVDSSSSLIRYSVDYIAEDGTYDKIQSVNGLFPPVNGFDLPADGTYRVAVYPPVQGEPVPEGAYIEVREAATAGGTVALGETVTGTAEDFSRLEYQLELEQHQAARITFASTGAQTYIRSPEGNILDYFGHAMVNHATTFMTVVAPQTGTYTIRAYDPAHFDVFQGEYILAVEQLAVSTLADDPLTLEFMPEEIQYLLVEVEAGATYDLTLTNADHVAGGASVRVYALSTPQESQLDVSGEDTLPTPGLFTLTEDGTIAIELRTFRNFEGAVTVQLQEIN